MGNMRLYAMLPNNAKRLHNDRVKLTINSISNCLSLSYSLTWDTTEQNSKNCGGYCYQQKTPRSPFEQHIFNKRMMNWHQP